MKTTATISIEERIKAAAEEVAHEQRRTLSGQIEMWIIEALREAGQSELVDQVLRDSTPANA